MRKREFIKKTGLVIVMTSLFCGNFFVLAGQGAGKKTNVIMIMADDIGFECYGCYGSEYYSTPNIDKLAAGGVRFNHAYSQPLCTPSRVKIMTGKYNFRNYIRFGYLDQGETTFAHPVKAAGYKTCVAGKWQLSPGDLKGPYKEGFDEYCLWHFKGRKNKKGKRMKKGKRYKSPYMFKNGKEIKNTEDKYGPDYATDFICDFIERNQSNPFVAYYPMILVHRPFIPTPDSVDWDKQDKSRSKLEHFRDMVAYMDKMVGRIIDKLDEMGLRENTLVMVTGDNGTNRSLTSPYPPRGEIKGGKGTMRDNGTHVAFVANWPGTIKPGTVVDSPIDFADVFPTITEVTGSSSPDDLDGQSMVPLMKGDESNARGWVFIDYSRNGPPFRHFVRDKRYKLYSTGKMYDVPNDWHERSALNNPEKKEFRNRLQSILDDILKDAPAPVSE